MRHAAKRDANEQPLIALAEALGAYMWPLDEPVDWLCGYRGQWIPTEIKNPDGRNRPTDQQVRFTTEAGHRRLPVWVWREEADVLRDLNARRSA